MTPTTVLVLRFGQVELCESQRLLRLNGNPVETEPKVFDLLSFLVRHRERVVSKHELLDHIWQGVAVGEAVIARAACAARKAIGNPDHIRTFYGRGYRFISEVTEHIRPFSESLPSAGAEVPIDPPTVSRRSERPSSLIGRRRELVRIQDVLQRTLAGEPALILVTGEPGIGKTRMLQEIGRIANEQSLRVLRGRCPEALDAPPLWPFIQVLQQLGADPATGGDHGKILAHIDSTTSSAGAEENRLRQCDAIAGYLVRAAQGAPLALLFDDMHRADVSSLLLLEHLVSCLLDERILIAVAYRDAEVASASEKSGILSRVLRQANGLVLPLSGLDELDVAALLPDHLSPAARTRFAVRLHETTGGNPLFLAQLIQTLDFSSSNAGGLWTGEIPSGVREAIGQQAERLSEPCRGLLRIAAVVGRDFPVSVLSRAASESPARTLELLDEAQRAQLIVAQEDPHNSYRFAHVLVRDVLYYGMSTNARAAAHGQVGRALEAARLQSRDERLAALAFHFFAAVQVGADADKAVDYAVEAGARALRQLAYEEASRYFEQALSALELCTAPDTISACAILLDLGTAYNRVGNREAAGRTLGKAAALCREVGATDMLARVALGLSPGVFAIEVGVVDEGLIALLQEALDCVMEDSKLSALLLGRLGAALYWSDQTERRNAAAERAWSLRERLADPSVDAHVRSLHLAATWGPETLRTRAERVPQALAACAEANEPELLQFNRLLHAVVKLECGDMRACQAELRSFEEVAEKLHQPQAMWMVRGFRGMLSLLHGRLDDVEREAHHCLTTGTRIRDNTALQTFGVQLAMLRIEQDRGDEVVDSVRAYQDRYPRVSGWGALLAYLYATQGDDVPAREWLEEVVQPDWRAPRDVVWLTGLCLAAETSALLHDAQRGAVLYEQLKPFADTIVVAGFGSVCIGSAHRYLGLAASAACRWELASEHLEAGLAANRAIGAVVLSAHAERELAHALRHCPDRNAQSKADELTSNALRTARRYGLRLIERRIAESNAIAVRRDRVAVDTSGQLIG